MPRPLHRASAIVGLALALLASGCTPGADGLSGRVVDDTVTLAAPTVGVAVVDLDAGFAPVQNGPETATRQRGAITTAQAIAALGQWARVASVTVEPGDRVESGDVIAVFEDGALRADVAAARAAGATARAQVRVLDKALDDVASNRSKLADARGTALAAIAKATAARSNALATRRQLVGKRAQLQAILDSLPPSIPPTLPPGVPRPPDPAQIKAAIAQIDAGIAKIDAGVKKIDAGLAKADKGLGTIANARGKLADARTLLTNARELARIARDTAPLSVRVARWRLAQATVRTPVAGTVVSAVDAGDPLAPGGTVAVIRPDGPSRVTTWITPAQVGYVQRSPLSSATQQTASWSVTGDWAHGRTYPARLVRVGTRALYPPTSFATREVHLTRAVQVELEVDSPSPLPAGAPAQVTLK